MKKNLVALLLVLAVVSVGLFAVTEKSFQVKTTVDGVTELKLKTEAVTDVEGYDNDLNDFTTATVVIESSEVGSAKTIAHIATKSNNRTGITLNVTASAMKFDFGGTTGFKYINYMIDVGGKQGTTVDGVAASISDVFGTASDAFTNMKVLSSQIQITVDADEYAAAATGEYVGTVTFNVVNS